MRAPDGTPIGTVRRASISNMLVYDADPRHGSIIAGIPGHEIEDVKLSDIRILHCGEKGILSPSCRTIQSPSSRLVFVEGMAAPIRVLDPVRGNI